MTQSPPDYVIGIDAGGTKTVCYLADETGRIVNESRAGGANLAAIGELEVEKVLHRVMDEAIADRTIIPAAICLGIAGVDREEDGLVIRTIMRRIGFKSHVTVTNDALVALVAGAGHAPGVVIISGTGSIAFGRNAENVAARSGGWGYILGDEGSGYWIGRLALRAVMREADGRGPATTITPRVLRHFNVTRAQDLVHPIYHQNLRPSALARLAHYVQEAHEERDFAAAGILENAARELLACAASVVGQLGLAGTECVFVLAGGMFKAVPWLAKAMTERIPQVAPRADVRVLDKEPAWGAVLLAIADLEGVARVPSYKR